MPEKATSAGLVAFIRLRLGVRLSYGCVRLNREGVAMRLVLTTNGQPVKTGDIVQLQNGSRAMVLGANPPCKANLVGSVYIQSLCEKRISREVYPSALSAVFSSRETMG